MITQAMMDEAGVKEESRCLVELAATWAFHEARTLAILVNHMASHHGDLECARFSLAISKFSKYCFEAQAAVYKRTAIYNPDTFHEAETAVEKDLESHIARVADLEAREQLANTLFDAHH